MKNIIIALLVSSVACMFIIIPNRLNELKERQDMLYACLKYTTKNNTMEQCAEAVSAKVACSEEFLKQYKKVEGLK